jgi:hypothetical protein
MNECKRLGEHVIGPPFQWRAAILSRTSGPGGLYNLRDALGFGSGLLIAPHAWLEQSALNRNLPCASKCQPCVSASPQYSY